MNQNTKRIYAHAKYNQVVSLSENAQGERQTGRFPLAIEATADDRSPATARGRRVYAYVDSPVDAERLAVRLIAQAYAERMESQGCRVPFPHTDREAAAVLRGLADRLEAESTDRRDQSNPRVR